MSKKRIADKKQQAWSLLQEKRFPEAISLLTEICKIDKKDFEPWHILGGLYGQLGMFEKAATCCRKAIILKPSLAEAHDNLGSALQRLGETDKAISCHRRAIQIKPSLSRAYYNLGNAFKENCDYINAQKCYEDAIQSDHYLLDAYLNLGNTLIHLKNPAEAEAVFRRAIKIHPLMAGAYEGLGRAQYQQGNIPSAIKSIKKSLDLDPTAASSTAFLGAIYKDLGDMDSSISYLQKAIGLKPDYFEAYGMLGNTLNKMGRLQECLGIYKQMLELRPDSPDVYSAIAHAYEKLGDYDRAYQTLQKVKTKYPSNINIAISMGLLGRNMPIEDDSIHTIERILENPADIDNDHRSQLFSLLGGLYDKKNEYDKAFQNYSRANNLKPYKFDMHEHEHVLTRIKKAFSTEYVNRNLESGSHTNIPVFIIGMPRSGTSLIEQILCTHPLVYGGGELDYMFDIVQTLPVMSDSILPYPECMASVSSEHVRLSAESYLEKLKQLTDMQNCVHITDKMPHNFINLGLIQILFPEVKVIHCIRNAIDNCLSCYFQDFGAKHAYTNNLSDLGRYYKLYRDLMRHWNNTLRMQTLDIEYEKLVGNPEKYSKLLIEFCGLEWDENCLRYYNNERIVRTASYSQVRRPVYSSSVGRWKGYERFLDPLIQALE